jgi:gas vesicle protein
MSENNRDLLLGLFIGGLIGATLGILFAPKSGRETREDILRKAKEEYEKAVEKSKSAYEAAVKRIKKSEKEDLETVESEVPE